MRERSFALRCCSHNPHAFITNPTELNKLKGTLPTELGLLTTLQLIDLAYNEITGTIPTEICGLTDLQHLWLNSNNMTGTIPDCSSFPDLRSLSLRDNELLTGSIPESLCGWTHLQSMALDRCGLHGPLPSCMGAAWADSMTILSLADNALTVRVVLSLCVCWCMSHQRTRHFVGRNSNGTVATDETTRALFGWQQSRWQPIGYDRRFNRT